MLIKEKDSLEQSIRQLETIVKDPNLPRHILERAKIELRTLKAGAHGEKDATYFINFDYGERRSWAIIHDLRIEHRDRVAQIDHLLISRFLEFYVLESKSFAQGIRITDRGEFLVEYGNKHIAIESPIEQTRRHAEVLQKLLDDSGILPTRLGMTLTPQIIYYVLVSPKSRIIRPPQKIFNTEMVIKSDELLRRIEIRDEKTNTLEVAGQLAKIVSSETLMQIARNLVALHKPGGINYYEKFGIEENVAIGTPPQNQIRRQSSPKGYFCFRCGKPITKKAADFCFQNKKRFGDKAYCFDCQKLF